MVWNAYSPDLRQPNEVDELN